MKVKKGQKVRQAMNAKGKAPTRAQLFTYIKNMAQIIETLGQKLNLQSARQIQSDVMVRVLVDKGLVTQEEMKATLDKILEEATKEAEAQEEEGTRVFDTDEDHSDAGDEGVVG